MIIHQIIIISMLVFAIHYVMLPGEIFGFIEKWWKRMEDGHLNNADFASQEIDRQKEEIRTKYVGPLSKQHEGLRDNAIELIKHSEAYRDKLIKKALSLEKLSQPIFRCPVCMAPWHGTYLYWLIPWGRLGLPAHTLWHWPIIVIAALGLNSIIVRVFKDE